MYGIDTSDEALHEQEMEADAAPDLKIDKCIACLRMRVIDTDHLCHSCGDTDARAELITLLNTK
jgi:hypothetical protein